MEEVQEGGVPAHEGGVDVPAVGEEDLEYRERGGLDGDGGDARIDDGTVGEQVADYFELLVDDGGDKAEVEVVGIAGSVGPG